MYRALKGYISLGLSRLIGLVENRRLRPLKGKYQGQRCFILGNGPSLKHQDLVRLAGEHTFVTNRFILHEQYDEIKPSFYCLSDDHFIRKSEGRGILDHILAPRGDTRLFVPTRFKFSRFFRPGRNSKVHYIPYLHKHKVWDKGAFSTNIEHGVYTGQSIIIDFALPIAYYMGFETIYLLGVDMNYAPDKDTHFFGTQKSDAERAKVFSRDSWYDDVIQSFQVVKGYFEENGRTIYDATHQGNLTVFEKVDFTKIPGLGPVGNTHTGDSKDSMTRE